MSTQPKTISVRQLHIAVKAALEAAKQEHPAFNLAAAPHNETLPLIYIPWIICGYPIPWPYFEGTGEQNQFALAFTKALAQNAQVTALGVDGKFTASVYVKGDEATVGFVPAALSLSE